MAQERFFIGWFQQHVTTFNLEGRQLRYVLVPETATDIIEIFTVDEITDAGRVVGRAHVNPLQLASPRDPDLTQDPGTKVTCIKEAALVANLKARASAAGNSPLLPEIVLTTEPPKWARFTVSQHLRGRLWRAEGIR